MRLINLFGTLAPVMPENTPPWEWLGQLFLPLDPASIRFVDLVGPGADHFDVVLNRQLASLVITPLGRVDYEALSRAGQSPFLSFGVRFFLDDGTVARSSTDYVVQVLDLDDTPPQSLRFATGGSVPINDPGAVIGILQVEDPDTVAGFTFRLRPDDAWQFEIVGSTLKLRPGVMLSDYDGPARTLLVEVSDGRQSAGFELRFNVTNPSLPGNPLANLVLPGERERGFFWFGDVLIGQWSVLDFAQLRLQDEKLRFSFRHGDDVWTPRPLVFDLIDARVVLDPRSAEATVWNLYDLVMNEEPSTAVYEFMGHAFRNDWYSEIAWARDMLNSAAFRAKYGALSNLEFARLLYGNSVDWRHEPSERWHAARLDAGLPREQLVMEIAAWREHIGLVDARADGGFVQERPLARTVDVMLRIGADIAPSQVYRDWFMEMFHGRATTLDVARWAEAQPGFTAKWGAMHPWQFVDEFFWATGVPAVTEHISYFAWEIALGRMSRADFMNTATHWYVFPDSYLNQKPLSDFGFS